MRLVAVVEDIEVIRRILEHLGLWLANTRPTPRAHSLPGLQPLPEDSYSQLPAAEEEDHSQLPARPLGLLNHPGRRTGLPLRAPVRLDSGGSACFSACSQVGNGQGWVGNGVGPGYVSEVPQKHSCQEPHFQLRVLILSRKFCC